MTIQLTVIFNLNTSVHFFISIPSLIFSEKLIMLSITPALNIFSLNLINPLELYACVNETKTIFSLLTKFINQ